MAPERQGHGGLTAAAGREGVPIVQMAAHADMDERSPLNKDSCVDVNGHEAWAEFDRATEKGLIVDPAEP